MGEMVAKRRCRNLAMPDPFIFDAEITSMDKMHDETYVTEWQIQQRRME